MDNVNFDMKVSRRSEKEEEEADDISHENGLKLQGYLLPEEIVTEILGKLHPEDILKCRFVCKQWLDIISFLLCNVYNKIYKTRYTTEILPFDLCYITLYGKKCTGNLLKNVNGEDQFKHWNIERYGRSDFIIEDPPIGSDPLPANIDDFNGHTSCFVTSYMMCGKKQFIDVKKDKHLSFIINTYKPWIQVSEWVAARFDCGAIYKMTIEIIGKNDTRLEKSIEHRVEQWQGSSWAKKEIIIEKYPDNVKYMIFEHHARDMQFWAGHYGMKMAGATVKLLLDKVKL